MKRILVPIDFSDAASNALHFAISLTKEVSADISIVHVLDQKYWREQPYIYETIEKQAHEKMEKLVAGISSLLMHDTILSPSIIKGKPDVEIVKRATCGKVDLIIMGTKGNRSLVDRLIGSHAAEVSSHTSVPILVVPDDAPFQGLSNILFAIDSDPLRINELELVNEIAMQYQSHVYLFHVPDPNPMLEVPAEIKYVFKDISYSLHGIEGNDVIKSVNNFCEQNTIDLVVMVRRKRNFIQNVFHESKTKREVRQAQLPLLILAD